MLSPSKPVSPSNKTPSKAPGDPPCSDDVAEALSVRPSLSGHLFDWRGYSLPMLVVLVLLLVTLLFGHPFLTKPSTPVLMLGSSEKPQRPTRSLFTTNYASSFLGAGVIAAPPSCHDYGAVLNDKADSYMLCPCSAPRKEFVVQLLREVTLQHLVLRNEEHFSSGVREFRVLGSRQYQTSQWVVLGKFEAENRRGRQGFSDFKTHSPVRFLKFQWVSSYGSEPWCTMTSLSVFGLDTLESWTTYKDEEFTSTTHHNVDERTALTDEESKSDEPPSKTKDESPAADGEALQRLDADASVGHSAGGEEVERNQEEFHGASPALDTSELWSMEELLFFVSDVSHFSAPTLPTSTTNHTSPSSPQGSSLSPASTPMSPEEWEREEEQRVAQCQARFQETLMQSYQLRPPESYHLPCSPEFYATRFGGEAYNRTSVAKRHAAWPHLKPLPPPPPDLEATTPAHFGVPLVRYAGDSPPQRFRPLPTARSSEEVPPSSRNTAEPEEEEEELRWGDPASEMRYLEVACLTGETWWPPRNPCPEEAEKRRHQRQQSLLGVNDTAASWNASTPASFSGETASTDGMGLNASQESKANHTTSNSTLSNNNGKRKKITKHPPLIAALRQLARYQSLSQEQLAESTKREAAVSTELNQTKALLRALMGNFKELSDVHHRQSEHIRELRTAIQELSARPREPENPFSCSSFWLALINFLFILIMGIVMMLHSRHAETFKLRRIHRAISPRAKRVDAASPTLSVADHHSTDSAAVVPTRELSDSGALALTPAEMNLSASHRPRSEAGLNEEDAGVPLRSSRSRLRHLSRLLANPFSSPRCSTVDSSVLPDPWEGEGPTLEETEAIAKSTSAAMLVGPLSTGSASHWTPATAAPLHTRDDSLPDVKEGVDEVPSASPTPPAQHFSKEGPDLPLSPRGLEAPHHDETRPTTLLSAVHHPEAPDSGDKRAASGRFNGREVLSPVSSPVEMRHVREVSSLSSMNEMSGTTLEDGGSPTVRMLHHKLGLFTTDPNDETS